MTWRPILLLLLAAMLSWTPARAASVRVVDGDTIRIDGMNYRLHGIDAPEKTQICRKNDVDWLCGQEAAAYLRRLVARGHLTCEAKGRDRYRRVVAVCRAGRLDLNREMVRAGLAWAYTAYARDYEAAELEARLRGRGVWARGAEALPPWEWRRLQRKSARNPG